MKYSAYQLIVAVGAPGVVLLPHATLPPDAAAINYFLPASAGRHLSDTTTRMIRHVLKAVQP